MSEIKNLDRRRRVRFLKQKGLMKTKVQAWFGLTKQITELVSILRYTALCFWEVFQIRLK